jgi:uncharacterized phage protein (TIGR02220 family)
MAERRMFAKTIIDSDAFLDMPLSTQALYFHLSMRADDDGFINNPKKIQRMIGAADDDLKVLITKKFIIPFESGIVVIKHWKLHNYIRNDRYKETVYKEEKAMLIEKDNKVYTVETCGMTLGIPNVNQMDTQVRLGKDSIDKDNNIYSPAKAEPYIPYEEIINYLNQKAGTHYKHSTKKTKTCIHARLQEGFTIDDFKTVIDKKCAEWIGTEWEKFLRPETLFGTKFESYLNAKVSKNSKPVNTGYPEGADLTDLDDIF